MTEEDPPTTLLLADAEQSSEDPLATLFPIAEKQSPFQDWPWPDWDNSVDNPQFFQDKELNFCAGMFYVWNCLKANNSPSLEALLGADVLRCVRSWRYVPNEECDYEADACNLAVFHKGAIYLLNHARNKIPTSGGEDWNRFLECVDDLEKNVHKQFIARMDARIKRYPFISADMLEVIIAKVEHMDQDDEMGGAKTKYGEDGVNNGGQEGMEDDEGQRAVAQGADGRAAPEQEQPSNNAKGKSKRAKAKKAKKAKKSNGEKLDIN